MSEEGTKLPAGFLSKIEILIIAVLAIIFFVWGMSRCNRNTKELERIDAINKPVDTLVNIFPDASSVDTTSGTSKLPRSANGEGASSQKTNPHATALPSQPLSVLYVTIDGLKLRTGPHLDSLVIIKLPLFEEVYFLGDYTDFVDTINLGYIEAVEPWFRVRHKKGHEGWVYGAGVDFYKYKREGVFE